MSKFCSIYIAVLLFLSITPAISFATHETDHRFTLTGHIYGESGLLSGTDVIITDQTGRVYGTGTTNGSGFYKILLHLHDSDYGLQLILKSGGLQKEFRVEFDQRDKRKERSVVVNIGSIPVRTGTQKSSLIYYGAIAIALAGIGTFWAISRNKKNQLPKKEKVGKKKGKRKKK